LSWRTCMEDISLMKLFIAFGGVMHRFTTKKLQVATQNRINCWFGYQKRPLIQTRSNSKRIYRRKTWFQPVLPSLREDYGMLIHMPVTWRAAAKKYWIQEKNRISRFESPQKYRHMDIQGLRQSTPKL
jgi:hypothetical protein